ncbi:hypothetical protein V5E38_08890 [Rossellomorea sp. GAMAL-10_SWC]
MKKEIQGTIINHVGEWQINFAIPVTQSNETKEVEQLSFEDLLVDKREDKLMEK